MASALLFDPIIVERPHPDRFLRKGTGKPVLGAGSWETSKHPYPPVRQPSIPRAPSPGRSLRFRKLYQRSDLPIAVEQDRPGRTGLRWTQPLEEVDVAAFLPIFVDGLIEEQEPFRMLAENGTVALIAQGTQALAPTIPHLIVPLKAALCSGRPLVVLRALSTLRGLATSSPAVGAALLGYHRHLLPPLLPYMRPHPEKTAAGKEVGRSLADAVRLTLATLDATGGKDALRSIRYFMPTYHRI